MAKIEDFEKRPRRPRTVWTDEIENRYLGALAATGALVSSCDVAGVPTSTVRDRRAKYAEFEEKVKNALERYGELLEKAAHRRAVKGVKEPVFYKGDVCGHVNRYSDSLLALMLKRRIAEYREKAIDVNVQKGGVLVVETRPETEDEWRDKNLSDRSTPDGD